jgi:hypothetical protein
VSNRIWQYFPRSPDPPDREDYFIIETRADSIPVLASVARRVMAELELPETPFWVSFRDVSGARHHIRSDEVYLVHESSARIRKRIRAFNRARQREADEDKASWDD